jgi:hypothetical protein
VTLRQPLVRRRRQQVRLVGRVRAVALHAAIRSDRISRVDRFGGRALVTARRAREWVLPGERARRWGAPQRAGAQRRRPRGSPVVTAQRPPRPRPGRDCEAENARGTSAYASGSGEEPRAWQPRGLRAHVGARDLRPTHS